ncbi:MAG: glycerol-3-phosphate 1-O-acyltransferase PlsY [Bacteroidales bacterium]
MFVLLHVALILSAYLLGSIPTSVWLGRAIYGLDIREHGSGNPGATNTFRVLGKPAGLFVFLIDFFKGFGAVKLSYLLVLYPEGSGEFITFQLALGITAMLGHIFPIYVGFKGGKGVATLFGVIAAISFYPTLIMAGIFLLVLFLTRYVSLSSIIAGISFPILLIVVYKVTTTSLIIFSLAMAVILLITHQKNIQRLLKKEENKVNLIKKRG